MIVLRWVASLVALSALAGGCSSNTSSAPTHSTAPSLSTSPAAVSVAAEPAPVAAEPAPVGFHGARCTQKTFGGARAVALHVPVTYSCENPAPLIIALHGYTASGAEINRYFGLTAESDRRGFLFAAPDGLEDRTGKRFWNATKACCNFGNVRTDDSAYLSQLVIEISAAYNVDAKRIYFVGHSNGGFMSFRMACEHSEQVAAVASLAGAMENDIGLCTPTKPVSVLQIHGTADTSILFEGGTIGSEAYPSASASVGAWATIDKCSGPPVATTRKRDLDSTIDGDETTESSATSCADGTAVSLWAVANGAHSPKLTPTFALALVDFLYAHPKP